MNITQSELKRLPPVLERLFNVVLIMFKSDIETGWNILSCFPPNTENEVNRRLEGCRCGFNEVKHWMHPWSDTPLSQHNNSTERGEQWEEEQFESSFPFEFQELRDKREAEFHREQRDVQDCYNHAEISPDPDDSWF